MANIYFLIIAIMQSIKDISISGGKPVILFPLTVVIFINGLKDFLEDLKRKDSDDEENNRLTLVFNKEKQIFEEIPWKNIKLGQILKINENERFPADLILLSSSEKNGICYIETKNLDGETNLKYKESNADLLKYLNEIENFNELNGTIYTKTPNEHIYEFDAKIDFDNVNMNSVLIERNSFLLRGCSLKQTKYIYGIVCYIGHNTKIMKNSPNSKTKTSKIEDLMNFQIFVIFFLQIILCLICGIISILNKQKGEYFDGKNVFKENNFQFFIERVGTWVLIFTNFVPISLLVTMEMVKFVQGMFMSWDVHIYDKEKQMRTEVQTSTLNEELGQVKYIFTDKTGTLTKNYMVFKKMSIGDVIYGESEGENLEISSDQFGKISNFNFVDDKFDSKEEGNYLFLLCMALCHTVIVDVNGLDNKDKDNKDFVEKKENILHYMATSPDEQALVNACRAFKFIFKGRDSSNNIFIEIHGKLKTFKVLNILEYSSERKRMSVIVKDEDTQEIFMFMKGADSIVKKLLINSEEDIMKTDEILYNFANDGLRTLMLAYRKIETTEYVQWKSAFKEACFDSENKAERIQFLIDKIEQNLNLLGTTAIEDKLQDNVPAALDSFIKTGIKVWMLTGDKTDTAKSIAFSCKLISHEFRLFEFTDNSLNTEMLYEELSKFINSMKFSEKNALIVSNEQLTKIMNSKVLIEQFYLLASSCNTVLCCRVSPKQKAEMVAMMRERNPQCTTLAIGDGANDVNMITTAHIGVGIVGVEGRQAARASDYIIPQFSFLKRLMFVHGREAYRKNSFIICYNFYKNILFVIPQFWFGFSSFFSGQTLYDPWIYQFFNIFFASVPIIWFGIYDREISSSKLMNDQKYYIQGMVNKLFHTNRFWKWVISGFWQGLIIFIAVFKFNEASNADGDLQDLWSLGSIVYGIVVIISNVRLLVYTNTHSIISISLFVGSILMYYLCVGIMSIYQKFENFNNLFMNLSSPYYYFTIIISVFVCIAFDAGSVRLLTLFDIIKDPNLLTTESLTEKKMVSFEQMKKRMNDCILFLIV